MPLVSVNVLCYNHAPFIKQRIESILQQTFTDYELLIWDDASEDESKTIIEQYRSHEKVKAVIRNQHNSGSGYLQWEQAIDAADAKYIWIAEGDDFASPDFLKEAVAWMEQDESIVMLETDSRFVKDKKPVEALSAFKNRNFPVALWHHDFVKDGKEMISTALCFGNCIINVSAVLFRTEALKKLNFNFSINQYSGDWALYIELLKTGKYAYCHQVQSYFRQHAGNTTKKGLASGIASRENFVIVNNLAAYLKKINQYPRGYIKQMNRYISIFNVPATLKMRLLFFYFKTNPLQAAYGLYYNFLHRIRHLFTRAT